jgi:hypothetical protein
MRWRSALLTVSSCALLLAGCGGGEQAAPIPRPPRIPADLAQRLAADADRIAAAQPGSCSARTAAARLQDEAIQAIQSRRIPVRYQEPLMSAANDLVDRLPLCTERTRRAEHPGKQEKQRKQGKHEKKKHEQDD